MTMIVEVFARSILDSRGNPTVEVEAILESGDNWIDFKTDKIKKQRVFDDNRAFIHVGETLVFTKEKKGQFWNVVAVRKAESETQIPAKSEKIPWEISVRQTAMNAVCNLYQGQAVFLTRIL